MFGSSFLSLNAQPYLLIYIIKEPKFHPYFFHPPTLTIQAVDSFFHPVFFYFVTALKSCARMWSYVAWTYDLYSYELEQHPSSDG
jgi:hypothetical protein